MLVVKGLKVSLSTENYNGYILQDLSLNVHRGKTTALVGESGSGKTTATLAMLGLVKFFLNGDITVLGEVLFEGKDILHMNHKERRKLLGTDITFIPQSAYAGLNPFLSIRRQAIEIAARRNLSSRKAIERFKNILALLDLADRDRVLNSYPHQLSGGMRQRLLIGMALLNTPKLLIADEPTTAVDRTRQVKVLDLIRSLCDEEGLGVLFVTHDMGVVARTADYVTVLLEGLVMESGKVEVILKNPHHPYTMSLLHSLYHLEKPTSKSPGDLKRSYPGCPFASRCDFVVDICRTRLPDLTRVSDHVLVRCHLSGRISMVNSNTIDSTSVFPSKENTPIIDVHDLSVSYRSGLSFRDLFRRNRRNLAVQHVSFNVQPGQCLGIVGESAAGKTTAMKAALRLLPIENGRIVFEGRDITNMGYGALRPYRAQMQGVFQNPDASLNPKMRVMDIILEPALLHRVYPDKIQARTAAEELFDQLNLEQELLDRYPIELSHGQKQRIAIARALITKPKLLFADEPVSAVDTYTCSRILGLLRQKQKEQMALVLISHDLEIIRLMSTITVVMYKGKIVELGPSEEVYNCPLHPYTELLMSAVLTTDPAIERRRYKKPSPVPDVNWNTLMCPFYPYCPIKKDYCRLNLPQLREIKSGHWVACTEEIK